MGKAGGITVLVVLFSILCVWGVGREYMALL